MERIAIRRPRSLLAVDLDGTLVRSDGSILAVDRAAIARAQRAGAAVTIATGRLAPSVLAMAESLGVGAPVVVASGAALVCPRTGALLECVRIERRALRVLLAVSRAHALAPFVCLADRILTGASGRPLAGYVAGWSPRALFVDRLEHALGDDALGGVVMTLALGDEDAVAAALTSAERSTGAAVQLAAFPLGESGVWALRAQPGGAKKGAMLARLAARLGVPRACVGTIGDSLDDLSMLTWAGASFAMGHAPPAVRREATCVLQATAETGGGVAEAVERWLARAR